jgi:hypothetical protein
MGKKLMGVGVIARDYSGHVKAALCSTLPFVLDPIVAKSLRARRALEFGRCLGFSSIVLEGDAKGVIMGLGSSEDCGGSHEGVIKECRMLLKSFCSWSINHVRREGNMAAH